MSVGMAGRLVSYPFQNNLVPTSEILLTKTQPSEIKQIPLHQHIYSIQASPENYNKNDTIMM